MSNNFWYLFHQKLSDQLRFYNNARKFAFTEDYQSEDILD
jgi:hypothetical protein